MRSNRCNPIHPDFMTDIADAYESAYTILLNLNKTWIQKQGDFFVESPIILLAAIIWFLKIYEGGKYCTFPTRSSFLTATMRIYFRYSHHTVNWRIISRRLWTHGKAGRRTSSKVR